MNGFDEPIFRRIPVAFYRTSTTGKLIAANPALANILGFDSIEEMMTTLETVETIYMEPLQRAEWLQRMATEGVILDFDVHLSRLDGSTIWVRDSARAIRDEEGTIQYYEGVLAKDAAARDYARLYLMPGVLHCAGGPGPDRVDWLQAVSDWVEKGKAPDRLLASKVDGNGKVILTRPLCPYPLVAIWDGKGDTAVAESFACGTRG